MVKMGTVWDRTVEFISDNLGVLTPLALITLFVPLSAMQSLTPLVKQASAGGGLGLSILLLVLSLIAVVGGLAVIALALDIATDARSAIRTGLARMPAVLLNSVLLALLFCLLILPAVFIIQASGVQPSALRTDPSLFPASALVYLLLVGIVGLWLAARLALMGSVVVGERRWVGAIGRSFRLTKGVALKIVGVILLYFIVSQVAGLAAKTVFGSILSLVAGNEDVVNVATVLTSIIVSAVATAFQVLAAVFLAKLYLALRAEDHGEVVAG